MQPLRIVDLVVRPEAVVFARPAVDRIIHLPDPVIADRVEVGALGEVLADRAVGVLVGAAPPGMVRQREIEDRAGRLLDPREVGELLALRQSRMCVPARVPSDACLSIASRHRRAHGLLPFQTVAFEMKI